MKKISIKTSKNITSKEKKVLQNIFKKEGLKIKINPCINTKNMKNKTSKNKLTNKEINYLIGAGENDTYTEDILLESARNFIENEMPKILKNEELTEEAINYYREGFLGRVQFGKCKKCGRQKALYSNNMIKDTCLDCRKKIKRR